MTSAGWLVTTQAFQLQTPPGCDTPGFDTSRVQAGGYNAWAESRAVSPILVQGLGFTFTCTQLQHTHTLTHKPHSRTHMHVYIQEIR